MPEFKSTLLSILFSSTVLFSLLLNNKTLMKEEILGENSLSHYSSVLCAALEKLQK